MASYDWFRMTWTSKNLMWKFNFGTCLPKLTLSYNIVKHPTSMFQLSTTLDEQEQQWAYMVAIQHFIGTTRFNQNVLRLGVKQESGYLEAKPWLAKPWLAIVPSFGHASQETLYGVWPLIILHLCYDESPCV
jgi:hypothetical protein